MKLPLLLLCSLPVLAQQTLHLTLDRAIQLALKQNPAGASAQRQLDAAEVRIREARAGYFPQVGFKASPKPDCRERRTRWVWSVCPIPRFTGILPIRWTSPKPVSILAAHLISLLSNGGDAMRPQPISIR
jgi:outer membrane efflux protein